MLREVQVMKNSIVLTGVLFSLTASILNSLFFFFLFLSLSLTGQLVLISRTAMMSGAL